MTVQKAETVTITLGDASIECLVMPDGSYRIAFAQVARLFGMPQKHASRDMKALLPKDSQYPKVRTDLLPRAIPTLDLTQFGIITAMLSSTNELARANLIACQAEAMERRIDAKVGVIRQEQERNDRYIVRRDSILSRHFWTDCIEAYMKSHDVSDNYKRFIYNHVSDFLNKSLFGLTSKQIRVYYGIGNNSPRDYFPSDTLKLVDTIEKATAVRVKNNDVCPKQALKDVVGMLGIEPSTDRL